MTQIADIELHRLPSRTNIMFSNLFNFQNKQKDGNNEGGTSGGKTEIKSKLSLGFKTKDKNKKQQAQPEVQQQPVQVSYLSNQFNEFFQWNYNFEITRQIDLVLRYLEMIYAIWRIFQIKLQFENNSSKWFGFALLS